MKSEINKYVQTWEKRCYPNGIPDEADERLEMFGKVPSYRRIARAILSNDLSKIGIQGKTSAYYSALKRIEISQRKNITIQLELFI